MNNSQTTASKVQSSIQNQKLFQMDLLTGIRELFDAYQSLLLINPQQNPGFIIRHLGKIFDKESNAENETEEEEEGELETLGKIGKVYQVYKTLSKWDPEEAPIILIQNLEEILGVDSESRVISENEEETFPSSSCENGESGQESFAGYNFLESPPRESVTTEETVTNFEDPVIILSTPQSHEIEVISLLSPDPEPVSTQNDDDDDSEKFQAGGNGLKRKSSSNSKDSRHKTQVTKKQKTYPCDFCDKMFRNQSNLTIHTRVHTGEKPYFCGICPAAFSQTSKEKLHIHKNHTHNFQSDGSRNLHMKVHSRPFPCGFCTWTFNKPEAREKHEKSIHGAKQSQLGVF